MAQLDRLLSVMVSQRATALRLDEGELAELEISGSPRPVTKTPLTGPQVVALLREIAPPDAASCLDNGQAAIFGYLSEDGAFVVQASREGTRWRARVTIDEERERQRVTPHQITPAIPAEPTIAPPPAVRTDPTPGSSTATRGVGATGDAIGSFDGSERSRASLDLLLRKIVELGASDLHLRCGEPPLLRLHGEMKRMDMPVLDPETLEQMLRSIMPERNRQEFSETNDTDYAYEIAGVARFRAN
ncbi:MAG: twitching motility protein, partial [Gemmatimonadetes bacterium]|nr:twitching motility protein [Gemmatimonadota bacterium]